ncbi:MAG: HpaII family restriction endonuclease, partial [Cetobacterium sp.]
IRVMTPKEWGKLQGFINYAFVNNKGEDEFTFPKGVSDNQLYKQFGNSVAIPVIEEIAKYIHNNLVNVLGGEMLEHKKDKLKKYNKGEWSEVYTFLKCLSESKFLVKDSNLENILAQYNIIEIYKKEYKGEREVIFKPSGINKANYLEIAQKVFEEIQVAESTTFEIPFLEKFAEENNFSLSKGKSKVKSDLDAKIEDELKNQSKRLEYSIKSQLASPATLLNASTHTNFLYKIEKIELKDVEEINSIDTKMKLKDKIEALYEKGYKIKGLGAESKEFKYNLNLLDGDLQEILSFILLYSYKYSIKNLNELIEKLIEKNPLNCPVNNSFFYKEKIGRFLMEVTASMTPGKKVTSLKASDNSFGGILLVERKGQISLLDNIHYKKELKNYLNKNLKLDTPSTSRYDMLNLKYDANKKE